jgi:ABC-type ATPase with predicted acetyltransferase domain
MPLYEYLKPDGSKVLLRVTVDERDKQDGLERVSIHTQINTISNRTTPESDTAKTVLKGYHAEECSKGSRFRSDFTPEQIKRAWANN